MDKLRLYDKKNSKFGFHKNCAGIGENAYQVRYGSLYLPQKKFKASEVTLTCGVRDACV